MGPTLDKGWRSGGGLLGGVTLFCYSWWWHLFLLRFLWANIDSGQSCPTLRHGKPALLPAVHCMAFGVLFFFVEIIKFEDWLSAIFVKIFGKLKLKFSLKMTLQLFWHLTVICHDDLTFIHLIFHNVNQYNPLVWEKPNLFCGTGLIWRCVAGWSQQWLDFCLLLLPGDDAALSQQKKFLYTQLHRVTLEYFQCQQWCLSQFKTHNGKELVGFLRTVATGYDSRALWWVHTCHKCYDTAIHQWGLSTTAGHQGGVGFTMPLL